MQTALTLLRKDVIQSLKELRRKTADHNVAEECNTILPILEMEGLDDAVYLSTIRLAWTLCFKY